MQVIIMIVKVDEENFVYEVIESPMPVLVEFYALWCGKCAMMEDVVTEFAAEHEGRIKVCQIDSERSESLAGRFGVEKVPTFVVFRAGKPVRSMTGVVAGKVLEKLFE